MSRLIFLLVILPGWILAQETMTVDYHVHVFSGELLSHLKERGMIMNSEVYEVDCEDGFCSNIDKIRKNSADKLVLLSGAYAYDIEKLNCNLEEYKKLVKAENDFIKKIVNSDRDKLYGLAGINPTWDFAQAELERSIGELKLDGIKMHFQGNQIDINEPQTLDRLKHIFKYLSNHDKIALIHLNGHKMDSGTEMAKSFITNFLQNSEKLTIVFAHGAGPGGVIQFSIDVLTEFEEFLKSNKFAEYKNLYFEMSGVLLTGDYPGKLDHQLFYTKMKSIGEKHFLFGSDYPFRTSRTYLNQIKTDMEENNLNLNSILTRNIFEN